MLARSRSRAGYQSNQWARSSMEGVAPSFIGCKSAWTISSDAVTIKGRHTTSADGRQCSQVRSGTGWLAPINVGRASARDRMTTVRGSQGERCWQTTVWHSRAAPTRHTDEPLGDRRSRPLRRDSRCYAVSHAGIRSSPGTNHPGRATYAYCHGHPAALGLPLIREVAFSGPGRRSQLLHSAAAGSERGRAPSRCVRGCPGVLP